MPSLRKTVNSINKQYIFLAFASVIVSFWIYIQYFTNLTFGDEYDNFAYSWLFKSGRIPYRDFFTHHFPALIFFGYPLEFISHSKFIYRVFVLLATFGFFTFFAFYLKGIFRYTHLIFMPIAVIAISFYSGFQFADGSFWAIYTLTAYFIVITKNGHPFELWESALLSILIFLTALSSPMHLAPFLLLFAYHIYLQNKYMKKNVSDNIKNLKEMFIILSALVSLFFLYFLLTKSFADFYFSTITFNNNYFYFRDNDQIIIPKIADFYLHSILNFVNHLSTLAKVEGEALLAFARALKFLILPGSVENISSYTQTIFTDFYNNFFSFEVFVLLFLLFGIFIMLVNKYKSLAAFSVLFIFFLRLRVPERIHEAPYYLFAFWMLAVAFGFSLAMIYKNQKRYLALFFLLVVATVSILFFKKNYYDFNQIAYNRFPNETESTVGQIRISTGESDKIMVIANESARYYYDSERLPDSYFVNFFPWYGWSEKLQDRLISDIRSYQGKYIVVNRNFWLNPQDEWVRKSLDEIRNSYSPSDFQKSDYILERNYSEE